MPVSGSDIVASADVLEAQIEKVRNKVQELFETTDTIAALVRKGGESEVISQKLYRIPLVLFRGGIFRSFNADAGDMGSGSGLKVSKLTAGFIYSDYVVEISLQSMDTTATSGQSVLNAFAYNFKNAMKELQTMDDIVFHTDGTGKVTSSVGASATGSWGSSLTTYTFASSTDTVGCSRLRPGMAVDVYNNAGSSKRAVGTAAQLYIDHVDFTNKVVYLSDTVTGASTTDILAIAGLSATLQSFQSTWPLSGDSFRHGLYYAMDANTSNYFLGQLKSSITELLANNVNAGGALLSHAHGLLLQDQIINRRDEDAFKGLVGIAHMAQRAQVYNIGIALSEWMRTTPSEKMIDVMPQGVSYSTSFPFAGVTCKIDKRQDKSRFDFIIPKLWGRAMLHDTKFHDVQGRTVFESRTSTGTLKAAVHFILTQAFDYYTVDPGAQGFISNLQLPSGY